MTGIPEVVEEEEEAMESASVVVVLGVLRGDFPFCCLAFLALLEDDLRLRV